MFGKCSSWRSNSSFWARSRTFSLEVKMRSHGFQASTKSSHQEATRKRLPYLSALVPVGLQADSLLEGFEKRIFVLVVGLDLLVVAVCLQTMLTEPVVRHLSGDWGRLPLVATADDLDASTPEPIEEGFQSGAGHCADLVPDSHAGNELSHLFGRPLSPVTPAEEAVIGLGLVAHSPHFFRQTVGRSKDKRIPLAEELDRSRSLAAAPAAA